MSHSDNRRWVSFNEGFDFREEGTPPEITIIESNEQHTLLEITIPGMWVEDIVGPDGYTYNVIEVPDCGTTNDGGMPELPSVRGLLGIPDDADVMMNVIDIDEIVYSDYYIWPHQRPIHPGEEWEFEKDEEFYGSDNWYPTDKGYVGEPGIFKYFTVDNVGYTPFEFNPALKQLRVNPYIKIDVVYLNGGTIQKATMNEYMANLFEFLIWNFDELPIIIDNTIVSQYLIITPDEFYDKLLEFSYFINQKYGYNCHVEKLSLIGNDEYRIKKYIQYYFQSHDNTDFVLLVGDFHTLDYKYIESPVDPNCRIASDYWYTLLLSGEKPDLYPEVAIGRLPINNAAQLNFVINKITGYYFDPQPPPPTDWRKRVLLVAHKENHDEGGFFDFAKMADKIANYDNYVYQQPNFVKKYGKYPWVDNDSVHGEIWYGVSSVCYLGHGNYDRWKEWNNTNDSSWTTDNVFSLTNYYKLPVVFNNSCLNCDLFPSDSLCKAWVLASYVRKKTIGAVSTMGYTQVSYSPSENDYHAEAIYRCIYERGCAYEGIGWIINISTIYELKVSNIDNYSKHNAYARILVGEPALKLRTKTDVSSFEEHNIEKSLKIVKPYILNIKNPVYDYLNISIYSTNETHINISMYDISGRKISTIFNGNISGEEKITYSICDLSSGVYIIRVFDGNNDIYRKVVIE